jgi:hypothetical protein
MLSVCVSADCPLGHLRHDHDERNEQRGDRHHENQAMESKNAPDQHLEAGGRIVSPAIWRLHRAKVAQDPADWLTGFEAGIRGDCYVYPAKVRDRLAWASGFVEGRAHQARLHNIDSRHRLQRLAGIRITSQIARPSWDRDMWGRR